MLFGALLQGLVGASLLVGCAGPQKTHFQWTHVEYERGEATKEEIDRLYRRAEPSCWNEARANVKGSSQNYDVPDEGAAADVGLGYMIGRALTGGSRKNQARKQYYVDCMKSKGFVLISAEPVD